MIPNSMAELKDIERNLTRNKVEDYRKQIRSELEKQNIRIAVLDDDPTGIQTIHSCGLYTGWEKDDLADGLTSGNRMFYVLTNSRSMTPAETTDTYRTIGTRLGELVDNLGVKLIAISRSDSTLRGHFAEEIGAMQETLLPSGRGMSVPFLPVMFEAGRYTYHGEHLVDTDNRLVRAEDTEFSKDREFGYTSSHLPTYIRSKLQKADSEVKITTFDAETQRAASVDEMADLIRRSMAADFLCPDALAYVDLEKFSLALLQVFAGLDESCLVCRSSSSFPRAISGQEPIPLLRGNNLISGGPGQRGVVFVGSHVTKTTQQLEDLLSQSYTLGIEVSTEEIHRGVLDTGDCISRVEAATDSGKTPVIYTSRAGLFLDDPAENLRLSRSVSSQLVDIFKGLRRPPSFIISKGGITSHDLLTRGIGVRKAHVQGAILPGVPVLMVGDRGDIPFVIFPGNVGSTDSVTEAVALLRG